MVTVIIAVFNARETLERAIESCLKQSYPYMQLVIIDGGSSDGTQDILQKYDKEIGYWESEPDRGVYHAWNKALTHASGDWTCFIGADDYWAYPDAILDLVSEAKRTNADLVSGKVAIVDKQQQVKRIWGKPWTWQEIKRHHCIAHPGMLHRKTCFIRNGNYDEGYKIAGDYDFSLRLGEYTSTAFIDKIFVCMGDSGMSHSMILKTLSEVRKIQSKHPEIRPMRAHINYIETLLIIAVKKMLGIH